MGGDPRGRRERAGGRGLLGHVVVRAMPTTLRGVASVHCAPHVLYPPLAAERELAKVEDRRLDHRLV